MVNTIRHITDLQAPSDLSIKTAADNADLVTAALVDRLKISRTAVLTMSQPTVDGGRSVS